jgi:hypothetical protein
MSFSEIDRHLFAVAGEAMPNSADAAALLEADDLVALVPKLLDGGQARGPRSDDADFHRSSPGSFKAKCSAGP